MCKPTILQMKVDVKINILFINSWYLLTIRKTSILIMTLLKE